MSESESHRDAVGIPRAGLIAGTAAWALLIAAGAPLLVATLAINRNLHFFLGLVCVCVLGLAYGGAVCSRNNRRLLVLCLSAAGVALLLFIAFSWFKTRNVRLLNVMLVNALLAPALAPFVAMRVRRSLARVWPLAGMWLASVLVLAAHTVWHLVLGNVLPGRAGEVISIPFLVLAGPWATQAARLVDFPNAGEFFSLTFALGLTISMAALIVFYQKWPQWRSALIIPYAALLIVWVLIGHAQLLNCQS